jgi:peptidoglycan/xylan/chitin deacetylase (PgdA/CDA1 family)
VGVLDQDNRDLVGYGRVGVRGGWPNGARVAVNLVVNYEEGSEYSFAAGDGRRELLAEFPLSPDVEQFDPLVESVFQYGSRAGIWRIQRILDDLGVACTFNACAAALELNPDVASYIQEAGHDVCCHGWRYTDLSALSRREHADHIRRAVASIAQTCGERPVGWFSRGATNETRQLLIAEGGFLYDSDALDDDVPYFVDCAGTRHLVVPYSFVTNDGQLLAALGNSHPAALLDQWLHALELLRIEGADAPRMMTIGIHPRWSGQPARAWILREFLEHALAKDDVWLARRVDIARAWIRLDAQADVAAAGRGATT